MNSTALYSGWQDQPDGRGTFDVLKQCGGTILLLCWSSVCPNVDSVKQEKRTRQLNPFRRPGRLFLFLLAILGPDLIFMLALGQLEAARRAKVRLNALDPSEPGEPAKWSLRQCFFINMGGLHIRPNGWTSAQQRTSFAINTTQMITLVQRGLMDLPTIPEEDIEDRNKTDSLARLITVAQVTWFTIQVFGRLGQGLVITTLELTTLAFILMMTATTICWWRKPVDIRAPTRIDLPMSLEAILSNLEGDPDLNRQSPAHMGTPLSFVGRDEWFLSRQWYFFCEILRKLHLAPRGYAPYQLDSFSSTDFPQTSIRMEIILGGPLIMGYGAIFMAAWNFHFPTTVEQLLWRIAAIATLAFSLLGVVVGGLDQYGKSPVSIGRQVLGPKSKSPQEKKDGIKTGHLARLSASLEPVRNLSPDNDPALRIRLRILLPTVALCIVYCFARSYILAEDLVALRLLPNSAFETVDWGQYSPIL